MLFEYKILSGEETLFRGKLSARNQREAMRKVFNKISSKRYINGLKILLNKKEVYKECNFPIFKRWVARKVDNRPKMEW